METIDYTKKRLGSMTDDGRIVKCAKCGRKGAFRPARHDITGRPWPAEVRHVIGDLYGIREIKDFCFLPRTAEQEVEFQEWKRQEAERETRSLERRKRLAEKFEK
jgi:hypothetical protein